MNFKKFFSVILVGCGILTAPQLSEAADFSGAFLIKDADGHPLMLGDGEFVGPQGTASAAPADALLKARLRRLWEEEPVTRRDAAINVLTSTANKTTRVQRFVTGPLDYKDLPGVSETVFRQLRRNFRSGPATPAKPNLRGHRAAAKIQAGWRGYKGRQATKALAQERAAEAAHLQKQEGAASTIQSAWRLRKENRDAQQTDAATKIQAAWRGKKGRDEASILRGAEGNFDEFGATFNPSHAGQARLAQLEPGFADDYDTLNKRIAAIIIQKSWRDKKERERVARLAADLEKLRQQEAAAAITLQKHWRGKKGRDKARMLEAERNFEEFGGMLSRRPHTRGSARAQLQPGFANDYARLTRRLQLLRNESYRKAKERWAADHGVQSNLWQRVTKNPWYKRMYKALEDRFPEEVAEEIAMRKELGQW